MTPTRALLLDIRELRYVSIERQGCHARVVVDMSSDATRVNTARGQTMPTECPCCRQSFDSALKRLNEWPGIYAALSGVHGVQIQIDTEIA